MVSLGLLCLSIICYLVKCGTINKSVLQILVVFVLTISGSPLRRPYCIPCFLTPFFGGAGVCEKRKGKR